MRREELIEVLEEAKEGLKKERTKLNSQADVLPDRIYEKDAQYLETIEKTINALLEALKMVEE